VLKGNHVYEDIMYNPEVKERFLSQFENKQTYDAYKRIFKISYELENMWSKDLVDFNLEEIKELLYSLNPLTFAASRSNISTVKNYIDWGMGYRTITGNINPLGGVTKDRKFVSEFVDKNVMLYISKHELDQLTNEDTGCKNAQDGFILSALFSGVSVHEICNLRKKDVDYDDNILHLMDNKGNKRDLKVDRDCIALARKAANETEYLKKNGEAELTENQVPITMLVDNEYVIRVAATKNTAPMSAVSPHVIYRRLSTIGELFENPYLTSTNIYRSGQIYMGYLLFKRDQALDKDQYIEIMEHYQMPKTKNGKYEFYMWSPLKDWINMENIKRLYDI
jgi:site-specific recombinase XerD